MGGTAVKTWSRRQATIALSSGEAEYCAVVKATAEALGVQALARDLGEELDVYVFTDSSAARGVANRLGLGKLRHVDVRLLWVQELVRSGRIKLRRVKGEHNPADMLTKAKAWNDVKYQLGMIGMSEADC